MKNKKGPKVRPSTYISRQQYEDNIHSYLKFCIVSYLLQVLYIKDDTIYLDGAYLYSRLYEGKYSSLIKYLDALGYKSDNLESARELIKNLYKK